MMGYELAYLLPALTRRFGIVDTQGPPTDCKAFSVKEKSIIFADVMKVINTESLKKNCKDYQIIIQKQ